MSEFKVGDTVIVEEEGHTFPDYDSMLDLAIVDKDQRIAKLEDALKRCLNIWGRGYEPTQDDAQTIGSQLYIKCNDLLKDK